MTYTDEKLRILVEEYITMQRTDFTLKSVCSYILYRAMEEERTKNSGIFGSAELAPADCERVRKLLEKMMAEQRIAARDSDFMKVMN